MAEAAKLRRPQMGSVKLFQVCREEYQELKDKTRGDECKVRKNEGYQVTKSLKGREKEAREDFGFWGIKWV